MYLFIRNIIIIFLHNNISEICIIYYIVYKVNDDNKCDDWQEKYGLTHED